MHLCCIMFLFLPSNSFRILVQRLSLFSTSRKCSFQFIRWWVCYSLWALALWIICDCLIPRQYTCFVFISYLFCIFCFVYPCILFRLSVQFPPVLSLGTDKCIIWCCLVLKRSHCHHLREGSLQLYHYKTWTCNATRNDVKRLGLMQGCYPNHSQYYSHARNLCLSRGSLQIVLTLTIYVPVDNSL